VPPGIRTRGERPTEHNEHFQSSTATLKKKRSASTGPSRQRFPVPQNRSLLSISTRAGVLGSFPSRPPVLTGLLASSYWQFLCGKLSNNEPVYENCRFVPQAVLLFADLRSPLERQIWLTICRLSNDMSWMCIMHCTWFRSIKKMLEASGERFLDAHVLFQPHPILVWCSVRLNTFPSD
jgi:hypothetical protein